MLALVLAVASCHVTGVAPFVKPDNECTPGDYNRITKAQVCVHKERPDIPAAVRRAILSRYGVPDWSGTSGELDHRVPFSLGGATDAANIWPEPWAPGEYAHRENAKDRLEDYVHARVCDSNTMRVSTARGLFLHDWVKNYRRYHLGA